MSEWRLTYRNLVYYARYYRLIALATVIAVAVIVGSLMVGDSVRTTLVNRVTERLGDTETVIATSYSFLEDTILDHPLLRGNSRGVLFVEGFIPANGRLVPVSVWGVDDPVVQEGHALMNEALDRELSVSQGNELVLRLPSSGLVPSGSLFVTKNYTVSARLMNDGLLASGEGGNLSLRNDQSLPLNLFVSRSELARLLDLEGKVNVILSNRMIDEATFATTWTPACSGLRLLPDGAGEALVSDQLFIPEQVVKASQQASGSFPNRQFSYLVNSIEGNGQAIPYSFATALDSFAGRRLQAGEALLSDYSARRLGLSKGDSLSISYFVSSDLKILREEKQRYVIRAILPIESFVADTLLTADFPGLSDVDRCTDWDSDLPIDMERITDEDEAYWNRYRATPKVLIGYESVSERWRNAYGSATALRSSASFDLGKLAPSMLGVNLFYPRESSLYSAVNGVDFGELFLALGFFIIVSALLLMLAPLSEMFYKRQSEWRLMEALGFSPKRVKGLLWREMTPVMLLALLVGVLVAIVYTDVVLMLLGGAWSGVTRTWGFHLVVRSEVLWSGLGASALLVGVSSFFMIRSAFRAGNQLSGRQGLSSRGWFRLSVGMTILLLAFWGVAWFYLGSVSSFIVSGICSLATAYCWGNYLLASHRQKDNSSLCSSTLLWASLFARRKEVRISFLTLAMGVFTVFSVGLNRQGFGDMSRLGSGTGGFSLWGETQVPLYYSMMTDEGRERLSLSDLPKEAWVLQCLRYKAEEASCLNLNKVTQPSVVGVDLAALDSSDFRIKRSLSDKDWKGFQAMSDDLYPALVDETVLIWNLGMALGDTLTYQVSPDRTVRVLLAGVLENSVFQGHIVIDKHLFQSIWPQVTGSDLFLVKVKDEEMAETKQLLSQALSEYGVRVTTTADRLARFYEVTDTYLTIFMILGSLGLLVGLFCLVVTVRKGLLARQEEIRLYSTLGFQREQIREALVRENRLVPYYAIGTGVVCALIGTGQNLLHVGWPIWLMLIGAVILFIGSVWYWVDRVTVKEINRVLGRTSR